jgi:Zn-finger nucleic acid-binding protein
MKKQMLCIDCVPHHEIPMVKTRCGPDLEVDRCPRCGGIWFDGGEFEKLIELGAFYISFLDGKAETAPENNPERRCPKCNVKLAVTKFPKMPEIEIDVCPQCQGLWCDAGELKAIGGK